MIDWKRVRIDSCSPYVGEHTCVYNGPSKIRISPHSLTRSLAMRSFAGGIYG